MTSVANLAEQEEGLWAPRAHRLGDILCTNHLPLSQWGGGRGGSGRANAKRRKKNQKKKCDGFGAMMAMTSRHSPDGGIQWLLVNKPGMCSIGRGSTSKVSRQVFISCFLGGRPNF